MTFTTLIDPATLAARLGDPRVVVVDCRFELADPAAGERAYLAAHIPGAVFADLERDLSGPKTPTTGRHPLPAPDQLTATFRRLGIAPSLQVVAYDQDAGGFASRLWWLLRWLGHDAVAVLDGGFARWVEEGRDTRSGRDTRAATTFTGTPRDGFVMSASAVAALQEQPAGWRLIDARAPERYRGDVEPIDPVAGHIPGAVNHPFLRNVSNGRFRSPEDLRAEFAALLGDVPPARTVCYCGSGVTACQNLLALEHAGLGGGKLYAGSWSEWVTDPTRPVERG